MVENIYIKLYYTLQRILHSKALKTVLHYLQINFNYKESIAEYENRKNREVTKTTVHWVTPYFIVKGTVVDFQLNGIKIVIITDIIKCCKHVYCPPAVNQIRKIPGDKLYIE